MAVRGLEPQQFNRGERCMCTLTKGASPGDKRGGAYPTKLLRISYGRV